MAVPAQGAGRPDRLLGTTRLLRAPSPGSQARRRVLIIAAKFLLPLVALTLLTSMAIWPELAAYRLRNPDAHPGNGQPDQRRVID